MNILIIHAQKLLLMIIEVTEWYFSDKQQFLAQKARPYLSLSLVETPGFMVADLRIQKKLTQAALKVEKKTSIP